MSRIFKLKTIRRDMKIILNSDGSYYERYEAV